jgi:hypothetical protein
VTFDNRNKISRKHGFGSVILQMMQTYFSVLDGNFTSKGVNFAPHAAAAAASASTSA